jgi:hypothetical protein
MKILTIKELSEMGDFHEEYGQTFWGTVEEEDMPVKFTKKIHYIPNPGTKLVAEEHQVKRSAKGNEYLQLKKVQLPEPEESKLAVSQPATATVTPTSSPVSGATLETVNEKQDIIIDLLHKLLGDIDAPN